MNQKYDPILKEKNINHELVIGQANLDTIQIKHDMNQKYDPVLSLLLLCVWYFW